jgi:hypothetical protein
LVFGAFGKIFIMIVKQSRDDVEGEKVALPMERHREWRQIYTFFGSPTVWSRWSKKDKGRDVLGGTPNTAVEMTALPTDRISECSRLLASIGGSMLHFLIFPHQLM